MCRKACGFPGGVDRPTFEVESEASTYNADPTLRGGFGGLDAAAVTSLAVGAPASDAPSSVYRDGVLEVPP